VYKNTDHITM